MDLTYRDKKLKSSLECLAASGLPFATPWLSWIAEGRPNAPARRQVGDEVFSIPLEGRLGDFDIALLPNGLMSLREYQAEKMSWRVLFFQTNPGHIVDLARDLQVGSCCVHLQEKKTRVH
jgi:hypothetical protein